RPRLFCNCPVSTCTFLIGGDMAARFTFRGMLGENNAESGTAMRHSVWNLWSKGVCHPRATPD
ncbi:MAG TPA: hypothetical protein VGM68_09320, partial [Rhizomicrobium sp.]